MHKTSIVDISNALGISRNTVSKVMNGRGYVTAETRKTVVEKAVEMGYDKLPENLLSEFGLSGSESARKPVSKNIAVIATSPDFSDYWVRIINGIADTLNEKQYNFIYQYFTFQQEKDFIFPSSILSGFVSGLIVINVYNELAIKKISATKIPVVYLDVPLGHREWNLQGDIVIVEGHDSLLQITTHMLRMRKRLAFIGDISYCKSIYERWRGFLHAHEIVGLSPDPDICFTKGSRHNFYFSGEVESVIDTIMEMPPDKQPQGIICANDFIAKRAVKLLKAGGYRIPQDILVSGFDGLPDDALMNQRLTTVYVDNAEIGRRLVEQIDWRIQNPDRSFEVSQIYGQIIFGDSTQAFYSE